MTMSHSKAYSECVVVAIIADVAERPNQRFVHVAVEHQRTASRMQGDLQYSVFALHPDVFVFVAVTAKHAHAPCRYPSFFLADLRSFSAVANLPRCRFAR